MSTRRDPSPNDPPAGTMEVVGFFSLRALLPPDGRRQVAPEPGSTVGSVLLELGLGSQKLGLILLNGCGAQDSTPVVPGDRLAVFPDYVPYHKVYGTCVI